MLAVCLYDVSLKDVLLLMVGVGVLGSFLIGLCGRFCIGLSRRFSVGSCNRFSVGFRIWFSCRLGTELNIGSYLKVGSGSVRGIQSAFNGACYGVCELNLFIRLSFIDHIILVAVSLFLKLAFLFGSVGSVLEHGVYLLIVLCAAHVAFQLFQLLLGSRGCAVGCGNSASLLDERVSALSIYLSVVHGVCGSSAYNGAGSRCCGYPSCNGDTASLFLWSLFVQHFLYVFGSEPVGNGL